MNSHNMPSVYEGFREFMKTHDPKDYTPELFAELAFLFGISFAIAQNGLLLEKMEMAEEGFTKYIEDSISLTDHWKFEILERAKNLKNKGR